jgi:hypothetical protein
MHAETGWRALLKKWSQALELTIVDDCAYLNAKPLPRYYHANVIGPSEPETTWRLKVINPIRWPDVEGCNRNNNCVHERLAQAHTCKSFARVPKFLSIPKIYSPDINISELIVGPAPSVNDLGVIIELLVNMQLRRHAIIRHLHDFSRMGLQDVYQENQKGYKRRLSHSLEGLSGSLSVSNEEVIAGFDTRLREPIDEEELTFAHGDFSFGNLKLAGNQIALLDFEHSHIGIGCIDLAHLYVNLISDGNRDTALSLRDAYRKRTEQEKIWFDAKVFDALVLERAAGKMNSMEDKSGKHFERLENLLESVLHT